VLIQGILSELHEGSLVQLIQLFEDDVLLEKHND
jgi:hypothetical protein